MAIDFTNRDPNDKNAVFSVRPAPQTGWIEVAADGAWTGKFSATRPKDTKGWREVGYATVMLQDGREFRAVLNENGQPISEIGDSTATDDARARAFAQQQTQAQRGDQEGDTRGPQTGPTREVYRGGKWVVEPNPVYQAPAAATANPQGGSTQIEGTPDPSKPGGFDNERPRKVTRDASGNQVGAAVELTGKDLDDWRASRERSRNPGGKTDADLERERKEAEAQKDKDAATARANAPKPQQGPNGQWGYWDTKPGQQPSWVPIASGPGAATPSPTQVNGKWGYWKPGENGAAPVWTEVAGPPQQQIPSTAPKYAVDWSKPGLGTVEYAAAVRADPTLQDEQKRQLITEAHQSASSAASQASAVVSTQQQAAGQEITQRGQDMSQSNARAATAGGIWNNALSQGSQMTRLSTGPGAASAPIFLAALGQSFSGGMGGGQPTPPRVQPGVAVRQVQGMPLPGANIPTVQSMLAQAGAPGAAASSELGQPGDLGLGAQMAQQAAQQAQVQAQQQAGAPIPPVNPAFGQPGNDPTAPVGMAPPIFGPSPFGAPATPQPSAMPVLASAMTGYDPTVTNRSLIEAGMDPAIVQLLGGTGLS